MKQKEILDANGTLNTAGLFINPNFYYNKFDLKHLQKLKEWDRYIIYNNKIAFDIGIYTTAHSVTVSVAYHNFKDNTTAQKKVSKHMGLGNFDMPSSPETGDINFDYKNIKICISRLSNVKRIKCEIENFGDTKNLFANFNITEKNCERFASILPSSKSDCRFCYTEKRFSNEIDGTIKFGGEETFLSNKNTFAFFSWGRGNYIPTGTSYFGGLIKTSSTSILGLNVFYNEQSPKKHENIVTYNKRTEKVSPITVSLKQNNPAKKWTIASEGRGINLKFSPSFSYEHKMKLGLKTIKRSIYFGRFSGSITVPKGDRIQVKNELGLMEKQTY